MQNTCLWFIHVGELWDDHPDTLVFTCFLGHFKDRRRHIHLQWKELSWTWGDANTDERGRLIG